MNDMRRTILWVLFSVSLVLLWDAWNRDHGGTSMFSPKPQAVGGAAASSTPAASFGDTRETCPCAQTKKKKK